MTRSASETAPAAEGLRERKRRETRARIAEAGLRLFLERGFEATTLDAIAAASNIARRTFFHYFDSKEAILISLQDETEAGLLRAIGAASPQRAPIDVVAEAMIAMISAFGSREARAIDRLLRSTEALRARKQANYEKQERMIFAALADKWPSPALRGRLRLVAMVATGALRLAVEAWQADAGKRPLQDHLREIFAALHDDVIC